MEIVRLQRLIKGYGDTFHRGLSNYQRIMEVVIPLSEYPDAADRAARLIEAALKDDEGKALEKALLADKQHNHAA